MQAQAPLTPEAYLKCLVKTYTGQACYANINKSLASRKTSKISKYLSTMLNQMMALEKPMVFVSETNEPVYRGVKASCIDLDDYRPGSIGFWPAFSSTSKYMNIAQRFS